MDTRPASPTPLTSTPWPAPPRRATRRRWTLCWSRCVRRRCGCAPDSCPTARTPRKPARTTLLALAGGITRFEGRSSFRTWLHRLAANRVRSTYRRLRRRCRLEAGGVPVPDQADPRRTSVVAGTRLDLLDAFDSVHPDHAEVVALRDVLGLSYPEIATLLDLPVGTVKSRLHLARRQVRQRLGAGRSRHRSAGSPSSSRPPWGSPPAAPTPSRRRPSSRPARPVRRRHPRRSPRAPAPTASPSRPPPTSGRPPAPPTPRGTPRTTPPSTTATPACQGAVRYDLPLAETEIELLRSLCFATGAVLRIQGIGPGLVTVDVGYFQVGPASFVERNFRQGASC
ncbi:RNA polymerase sigma factor [Micromonospora sp. NPDC049751]|uniref:RNA polymerase sigma factor n=1 Tax=unclassified Micromonospora TaxID=2617518 RepID=UPI0033F36A6F